jgi:hypothetical protein
MADRPGIPFNRLGEVSKLPPPPGALDSVPAKFSQEPPYFRAGRPPLEPFWPLICPISYSPVVEPMTFVNFDL